MNERRGRRQRKGVAVPAPYRRARSPLGSLCFPRFFGTPLWQQHVLEIPGGEETLFLLFPAAVHGPSLLLGSWFPLWLSLCCFVRRRSWALPTPLLPLSLSLLPKGGPFITLFAALLLVEERRPCLCLRLLVITSAFAPFVLARRCGGGPPADNGISSMPAHHTLCPAALTYTPEKWVG